MDLGLSAPSEIRAWKDLALFGGEPAFSNYLYVNRPNPVNRPELFERIGQMLDSGWLSNGPFVLEFEEKVAQFLEVRHCVAVTNATVGLELLVRTLGLRGEVIVPSYTFIATALALRWMGLTPVFCDVDLVTHNLDPLDVAKRINPSTAAILGVHLWGHPCDIDSLTTLAKQYSIPLLFDAAHSFACTYKGKRIGGFGQAEVFSFHATKFFSTGEGGIISTNDASLAKELRKARNFGMNEKRMVLREGTNAKMSEMSAAMGLAAFSSIPAFLAQNRANSDCYGAALKDVAGIRLHNCNPCGVNNFQYIVAELDEHRAGIGRDQLLRILNAEHCMARSYFHPGCHRETPFENSIQYELPNTDKLAARVLVLPNGMTVAKEDIQKIGSIIRSAIVQAKELPWQSLDLAGKSL